MGFLFIYSRMLSWRVPCQAGTTRLLCRTLVLLTWHILLTSWATCWENSQFHKDSCQAKKTLAWCEILRKRLCKRTRTKNLRRWSEMFFLKPMFLHSFCFAKKLALAVQFFGYSPAVGCLSQFVQLFQAIATTAVGQLNLQGGNVNPVLSEMQLQLTSIFARTLTTQNSETFDMEKFICLLLFVLRLWWHNKISQNSAQHVRENLAK